MKQVQPFFIILFVIINVSLIIAQEKNSWNFNTAKPQELVDAYVKISGAVDSSQVYLQYYGEIVAIIPGEKQIPLFKLKGLVREQWTSNEDGSYSHENYDHGLFCDWETGKVLEEYQNPFTGEINIPLHYNSGPITETIGLGEGQSNPSEKTWIQNGNQIIVTADRVGREFTNPVNPEKYPMASTGEKVQYSWMSSYFANTDDLANPNLKSVNASHNWVFITNFPAWMKVGNKPGYVVWRWAGKKFSNQSEIDPYILSEVEKRKPGFLTVEKPWPLRSDGWTQYTREIKPEVKE